MPYCIATMSTQTFVNTESMNFIYAKMIYCRLVFTQTLDIFVINNVEI